MRRLGGILCLPHIRRDRLPVFFLPCALRPTMERVLGHRLILGPDLRVGDDEGELAREGIAVEPELLRINRRFFTTRHQDRFALDDLGNLWDGHLVGVEFPDRHDFPFPIDRMDVEGGRPPPAVVIAAIEPIAVGLEACWEENRVLGRPLLPGGKKARSAEGAIVDFHLLAPARRGRAPRIALRRQVYPEIPIWRSWSLLRVGAVMEPQDRHMARGDPLRESVYHAASTN